MKLSPDISVITDDASTMSHPKSTGVVKIVDPLTHPNWDELVLTLPGHSFFHTAAWARVLVESYQYRPLYFGKFENGGLRALVPVMEVDSWLTGKRGVSLPFSDACPILATDDGSASELFRAITDHGRANRWKYIEFRDSQKATADAPPSESFYDHTIELSGDPEKVFAAFESSVRRAIRKGEKSGVTLEISRSIEGMKEFYALHCGTRQKHGAPPQPFSFFENFHRNVIAGDRGFVVIARFEGRPIAANVFVDFGKSAIYKYGASDENFQNLRSANLVMWYGIQWYARAGFERLGFGRTDKANEGLRRYKLGWGAQEHSVDYFKYDLRANRFVTGAAESSQARARIMNRIPIPIARIIGNVLYRHVA